jgi:cytochrome c553
MKKLVAIAVALASTVAWAEDRFENVRQPWYVCAVCHGAKGEGNIGPALAGRDADYIIGRLLTYKKGEYVGVASAQMWSQAKNLTDGQIGTMGVFIQEGFPEK